MRVLSWFLLIAALAVLAGFLANLMRNRELTPEMRLARAREEMLDGAFDEDLVLTRLDDALVTAAAAGRRNTCAEILKTRAELFHSLGADNKARSDLQLILDEYDPDSREVQELLVELDLETESFAAGRERIRKLLEADPSHGRFWVLAGQLSMRSGRELLDSVYETIGKLLAVEGYGHARELARRIAYADPNDELRIARTLDLRSYFGQEDEEDLGALLGKLDEVSAHFADAREKFAKSMNFVVDAEAVAALLELLMEVGLVEQALDITAIAFQLDAVGTHERAITLYLEGLNAAGCFERAQQAYRYLAARAAFSAPFYREGALALYETGNWQPLGGAGSALIESENHDDRMRGRFYLGVGLARAARLADEAIPRIEAQIPVLEEEIENLRVTGDTEAVEEKTEQLGLLRSQLAGHRSALARRHLARKQLRAFLDRATDEVVPGCFRTAWGEMVGLVRVDGQDFELRQAITGALAAVPDLDPELWLELADIQLATPHGGYSLPLESLTHAICLMPERRDELMEQWVAVGEKDLESLGIDVLSQMESLRSRDLFIPAGRTGPYELFRLAQLYQERNEPLGAEAACKRLRDDFPAFLPAIDILIDALLDRGDDEEAAEVWVERLEVAKMDAAGRELYERIPPSTFRGEQRLRMMRADPEGLGREFVIRHLYETDRGEEALEALLRLGKQSLTREQVVFAAGIMIDLEQPAKARELLADLLAGNDSDLETLALRLELAAALGESGELEARLREIKEVAPLPAAWALARADDLLRYGFPDQALRMLDLSELEMRAEGAAPPSYEQRGPALMRRAVAHAALGDLAQAEHAVDRAEAFKPNPEGGFLPGDTDFARLLIHIQKRDWARLPTLVERVARRGGEYRANELQEDTLRLLAFKFPWQGDPTSAPRNETAEDRERDELYRLMYAAAEALAGRSITPVPTLGDEISQGELHDFLLGTDEHRRDPREALGILLAMQDPRWLGWARSRLEKLTTEPEGAGRLWPNYLYARTIELLGWRGEALRIYTAITAHYQSFGPAWRHVLAHAEQLARKDPEKLIELQEARDMWIADPSETAGDRALTNSIKALLAGDYEDALAYAEAAAETKPMPVGTRVQLARALFKLGQFERWLSTVREMLVSGPPEGAALVLPEILINLEAARVTTPPHIDADQHRAVLEELARILPNDPLIPIAIARQDLAADELNPELAIARAFRGLDRFRTRHPDQSIDHLRPGSTRIWVDQYLRHDPRRAESFVREQLLLEPGSFALWKDLAKVLAARGKVHEAIETLDIARRILPDAETELLLAEDYTRVHCDLDGLREILARLKLLGGAGANDYFLPARMLLNRLRPQDVAQAKGLLRTLWDNLEQASQSVPRMEIARLHATALELSGTVDELREARMIFERALQGTTHGPYEKAALTALSGLALHPRGPRN